MNWIKKYAKRIGFDVAGYGLIVLGLAIGWVPGPGGIPLILAGLAVLSIHNHWAKRLLAFAKEKGDELVYILFPQNKKIEMLHDFISVILVLCGSYLLIMHQNMIFISIGIACIATAAAEVCFNRRRLKKWRNKR